MLTGFGGQVSYYNPDFWTAACTHEEVGNNGDRERSESNLDCDQLKPLDFCGYTWK